MDAALGEGPLDDLLELLPEPPDFRSFVVETVDVVVVDPEDDKLVPEGSVEADTVGLIVEPPDADVDVECELVVIDFREADVDAVLW